MPTPVYSQRFYSGQVSASAGAVGPVVPAGVIWVVRDIDVLAATFAPNDAFGFFSATNNLLTYWKVGSTPTPVMFQWQGRQVFAQGEHITFQSFQGSFNVMCSGYQLTLP